MTRSKSDYDRDELESIARKLGYESWDAVPRIPRNQILGSIEDGVTVPDDGEDSWDVLAEQLAAGL